jgi:hypothetical protein
MLAPSRLWNDNDRGGGGAVFVSITVFADVDDDEPTCDGGANALEEEGRPGCIASTDDCCGMVSSRGVVEDVDDIVSSTIPPNGFRWWCWTWSLPLAYDDISSASPSCYHTSSFGPNQWRAGRRREAGKDTTNSCTDVGASDVTALSRRIFVTRDDDDRPALSY